MMDGSTRLRSVKESDNESEISAGPQLEPRRTQSTETPIQDAAATDITDEDSAQTLTDTDPTLYDAQGSAKSQLEQQPFVVPYPSQRVMDPRPAGTRIRGQNDYQSKSTHANAS